MYDFDLRKQTQKGPLFYMMSQYIYTIYAYIGKKSFDINLRIK